MRVEWGTHSLESLNHLSPFIKFVRAALKSQVNLLDLVYWKKNYNKETYAYRCFFLKVFYIIHQSNQNMKTNFDNILRLQNGNSSLPLEFLDANCSEISEIKLQIAVQNL